MTTPPPEMVRSSPDSTPIPPIWWQVRLVALHLLANESEEGRTLPAHSRTVPQATPGTAGGVPPLPPGGRGQGPRGWDVGTDVIQVVGRPDTVPIGVRRWMDGVLRHDSGEACDSHRRGQEEHFSWEASRPIFSARRERFPQCSFKSEGRGCRPFSSARQ